MKQKLKKWIIYASERDVRQMRDDFGFQVERFKEEKEEDIIKVRTWIKGYWKVAHRRKKWIEGYWKMIDVKKYPSRIIKTSDGSLRLKRRDFIGNKRLSKYATMIFMK